MGHENDREAVKMIGVLATWGLIGVMLFAAVVVALVLIGRVTSLHGRGRRPAPRRRVIRGQIER